MESTFKDIGNISGLTVFDAGPEGFASRFLAERIGDGRIIGVNIWLGAYKVVRENVGELMDKVVLIKDDMRHMDYLKDNFFDLVMSYATIESIESLTPGGTLSILCQFYRILKQNGRFLAIEHPPLQEVKPLDEAQGYQLKLIEIHDQIYRPVNWSALEPSQLSNTLRKIGFEEIYWKTVSQGEYLSPREVKREINGLKNLAEEVIQNQEKKEEVLRQIQEITKQVKRTGLRTPPYYALYARKP